jgi:hypothetical protein
MSQLSFDWRTFLETYNREILSVDEVRKSLPADVVASGWVGSPGASEVELAAAEARLGITLPPSYRSFPATNNGWHEANYFVYELWPAATLAWFREQNQQWIDAYVEPDQDFPRLSDEEYFVYGEEQLPNNIRTEYLQTALQISDEGDSAVMLLNPEVSDADGEWEAWFFANWVPGARRYRTFREMMEQERVGFNQLTKRE